VSSPPHRRDQARNGFGLIRLWPFGKSTDGLVDVAMVRRVADTIGRGDELRADLCDREYTSPYFNFLRVSSIDQYSPP
jgi:hypothetical protein